MHKTVVINAVGLTPQLLGPHTPRLRAFADSGSVAAIQPMLPAVTTSVQATYLTGTWPAEHGIVGNGWYFRDTSEVRFWQQSSHLVQRPRLWETARKLDQSFTCANLFWWNAMYSTADVTVTPRPMYPADGRKIPDVWTHPPELRGSLQSELERFPLFKFWGPLTSIDATRWIADSAMCVDRQFRPTLTLIYLPHLDYCLQRRGPGADVNARDLQELDDVFGRLVDHYESAEARIIVLSEYGIEPVSRPIHLNRVLRERGLLAVREELGRELLDAGASMAFAVADHQVAHVYVNDASRLEEVRSLLSATPGVERVLDQSGKAEFHLDHERSGELVAIAAPDCWFTYYYWMDDARMPDFARTVDIHRKPGYDPAELFFDPAVRWPRVRGSIALLKRALGFRSLMRLIPADASLVRGSHGRVSANTDQGPLLITRQTSLLRSPVMPAIAVHDVILRHLTDSVPDSQSV